MSERAPISGIPVVYRERTDEIAMLLGYADTHYFLSLDAGVEMIAQAYRRGEYEGFGSEEEHLALARWIDANRARAQHTIWPTHKISTKNIASGKGVMSPSPPYPTR